MSAPKTLQEKKQSSSFYMEDEAEPSITMEELEESLTQTRQELIKAQEQVKELTQQLATTVPRSQALQVRRELESRLEELISENQELTDTIEEERKEREWGEKELRSQYEATALIDKEMHNLQEFIRKLHEMLEERGKSVELQKEERDAMGRLLEEAKEEVARLKKESGIKSRSLNRLEETHKELAANIKIKDDELTTCQKEVAASRRHYEQLQKELKRQIEKRVDVDEQLKMVRGQVKVATEQVRVRGRQERMAKRQTDRITKEKEAIHRNLVKASAKEKEQTTLIGLGEKEKQQAQNLLVKAMLDLHKQDKLVVELQDARDRQMDVTAKVEAKVVDLATEVEATEREVEGLCHHNILLQAHIDKKAAVIEAQKSDNFALSRQLNVIKAEKAEVGEQLNQYEYIVQKMTDVCKRKEKTLSEVFGDLNTQKTEHQDMRQKLLRKDNEVKDQQLTLQYQEGEKLGLQRIIEKQEGALEEIRKIFREERTQRGMELTTLSRRNDEVSALQNRVQLLEHILRRGNKEYGARLREIRTLRTEMASLKDERDVLLRQVRIVKSLKEELVCQQNLLVAALKRQANLQTALVNNKALHPKAKQQVSSPEIFEQVKKTQHIQKRYLSATERIAALEAEVSQRTREGEEFRRLVERTSSYYESSPDSMMTRIRLQNKFWAKEEQLKSVTAALNSALLKQEENEHEKQQMKNKIDLLTSRVTQLQRTVQALRKRNSTSEFQKSE